MKVKNSVINTALAIPQFDNDKALFEPNLYFRNLCKLVKQHPLMKLFASQRKFSVSPLINGQKLIKPKMFNKVVAWMQKLCLDTLQFSLETFEISTKFLKSYLQVADQSPKSLQMLGCIALHIASKINQKTIISIQSYIQCCMNIFDKKQFEEKQAQMCQKVLQNLPSFTFFSTLDFIKFEIKKTANDQAQEVKIKQILKEILKDIQFLQIQPLNLACNLYSIVQCNPGYEFQKEELLSILKSRKFQY